MSLNTTGPAERMGPVVRTFTPVSRERRMRVMLIFIVIAVIAVISGGVLSATSIKPAIALFVVAALFTGLTALGIYRSKYVLDGLYLAIHQEGIDYCTPNTRITRRYDEIANFFDFTVGHFSGGQFHPTQRSYEIELVDGRKIKLDATIEHIEYAAERIESETIKRRLPAALAVIDNGQEYAIGHVGISATGIRVNSKSLTWSEVQSVTFIQDQMRIKKKGGVFDWAGVEYHILPNSAILVPLLEYVGAPME